MNFFDAIKICFKKYSVSSDRASRSEYWYFSLFIFIGSCIFNLLDYFVLGIRDFNTFRSLSGIFSLVILLPSINVIIRRLHDVNRSGGWVFVYIIVVFSIYYSMHSEQDFFYLTVVRKLLGVAFLGMTILVLVWNCTKGTNGDNRFGPDPLTL
jgi:uncharacterized membrane protein YhaH (DUF805 family)